MRKLTALSLAAVAGVAAMSPAFAADLTPYPPVYVPDLPPVDYGLGGSFYLRGSIGGDIWTAVDGQYCACVATFTSPGYGLDGGVGFGYETGDGLRADVTLDYLHINGLTAGTGNTVNLRSGLLMANAYYDFMLDGGASVGGGWGAYAGVGIGAAKNYSEVMTAGGAQLAWGTSLEAAGAVMAGVTYDMGNMVADVGYRGIYMNKVMSQPANIANAYVINNNWINEIRGTLRYRF